MRSTRSARPARAGGPATARAAARRLGRLELAELGGGAGGRRARHRGAPSSVLGLRAARRCRATPTAPATGPGRCGGTTATVRTVGRGVGDSGVEGELGVVGPDDRARGRRGRRRRPASWCQRRRAVRTTSSASSRAASRPACSSSHRSASPVGVAPTGSSCGRGAGVGCGSPARRAERRCATLSSTRGGWRPAGPATTVATPSTSPMAASATAMTGREVETERRPRRSPRAPRKTATPAGEAPVDVEGDLVEVVGGRASTGSSSRRSPLSLQSGSPGSRAAWAGRRVAARGRRGPGRPRRGRSRRSATASAARLDRGGVEGDAGGSGQLRLQVLGEAGLGPLPDAGRPGPGRRRGARARRRRRR